MKHRPNSLATYIIRWCLAAALALGLSACMAFPTTGADSWSEEVLLHDGQKIVVERSQTYGPSPVIEKWPLVREHTLRFSLPSSTRELQWTTKYAADIGGYVEFVPLAVHVLHNTPYVIATPVGCLGYNKWGRPNPPYVVFRHDGNAWQPLPLSELPTQFTKVNLVVSASAQYAKELTALGLVNVEAVRRFNESVQPPELRTIVREPILNYGNSCSEMITDGKGGWLSVDWFRDQKDIAACRRVCEQKSFGSAACPCAKYFGGN